MSSRALEGTTEKLCLVSRKLIVSQRSQELSQMSARCKLRKYFSLARGCFTSYWKDLESEMVSSLASYKWYKTVSPAVRLRPSSSLWPLLLALCSYLPVRP